MSWELVERIARAIIIGSGGERAADHAKEFDTANWADAKRSALEVIPIINAEIAAERERCAGVVDAEVAKFAKSALPTMPKLKAALMEYFSIIAAAIRSQP